MTEPGKRVLELALLLTREERVEVAAKLVHSIHAFTQAEAAWGSMIERRARRVLAEESAAGVPAAREGVFLDVEADLELAVSWYEEHHSTQVSTFLHFVTDAIKRIKRKPDGFGELNHVAGELGVRRIFLREFPYAMAFIVLGKELRVLAVAHTYRAPEEREISLGALVEVEQWLSANGVRALTSMLIAGLAH